MTRWKLIALIAAVAITAMVPGIVAVSGSASAILPPKQVVVPEADQFTPFVLNIKKGESVQWVNNDTDDHTVVSDDAINSADNNGTEQLLVGTDDNHGQPGTFTLRFGQPGTFVYYCEFHAHLDANNQPVAPGPDGGIQDTNGNYGTPMMGVIIVR